jgi:hypothetical protein
MLSRTNLKDLDGGRSSFIVGSRMTKALGDLESHFYWNGEDFTDGQIIDAKLIPATEVITKYHDLWNVEQSLRMSKHDLAARPIFYHTRGSIEGSAPGHRVRRPGRRPPHPKPDQSDHRQRHQTTQAPCTPS